VQGEYPHGVWPPEECFFSFGAGAGGSAHISKRIGHSRASFTMDVYAHLMPGQDSEAAKRTDTGLRKALEAATRVAG
jgi:hypothetical protein